MSRVFLVLLGLVVLLFLFRRYLARRWRQRRPSPRANPAAAAVEEMVRCAHCDLYVPRSASWSDGRHGYCSISHRLAGPRPGRPL